MVELGVGAKVQEVLAVRHEEVEGVRHEWAALPRTAFTPPSGCPSHWAPGSRHHPLSSGAGHLRGHKGVDHVEENGDLLCSTPFSQRERERARERERERER